MPGCVSSSLANADPFSLENWWRPVLIRRRSQLIEFVSAVLGAGFGIAARITGFVFRFVSSTNKFQKVWVSQRYSASMLQYISGKNNVWREILSRKAAVGQIFMIIES